jgi:hypothetical protein
VKEDAGLRPMESMDTIASKAMIQDAKFKIVWQFQKRQEISESIRKTDWSIKWNAKVKQSWLATKELNTEFHDLPHDMLLIDSSIE